MRRRVAERTALAVRERATVADDDVAVVVPLGRIGTPGSREERTCDRCRTFVPVGVDLMVFALQPAPWLYVVGGLCPACWGREVAR